MREFDPWVPVPIQIERRRNYDLREWIDGILVLSVARPGHPPPPMPLEVARALMIERGVPRPVIERLLDVFVPWSPP